MATDETGGKLGAARAIVAAARGGALGTLDETGAPFVSWVAVALAGPLPVLLLSGLADHTKNLARDARASLLFVGAEAADPLARPRVTLSGRCLPLPPGEAKRAALEVYLGAHPTAERLLSLSDFALYALAVESVRFIGGFAQAVRFDGEAWLDV